MMAKAEPDDQWSNYVGTANVRHREEHRYDEDDGAVPVKALRTRSQDDAPEVRPPSAPYSHHGNNPNSGWEGSRHEGEPHYKGKGKAAPPPWRNADHGGWSSDGGWGSDHQSGWGSSGGSYGKGDYRKGSSYRRR